MNRRRRALVLGVLGGLLALAPGPARARRAAVGRPTQLRLEGYIGAPPEGQKEVADLTLRWDGHDHRFQVTKASLVGGDRLASSVLDQVRPYRPNFTLRGPKELLHRLDELKPGEHVTITGMYRSGTRDLLLGGVEGKRSE